MEFQAKLAWFLYTAVGKHLPDLDGHLQYGQKRFRRWCASRFCASIAPDVNIERDAVISKKVSVGRGSGIGRGAYLQGETHIGENVMMGPECMIWTINHETEDPAVPMCRQGTKPEQPVFIGNDVWIGSRVTILPGTRIGNGVIIGAGAVVSGEIPDMAVAAGNPAKIVKYRK